MPASAGSARTRTRGAQNEASISRRGLRHAGRDERCSLHFALPVCAFSPIQPMRASLGQPLLIENVTGASGTIGVGRAVRAAPDGYTVSIGNWPSHVVNGATYQLSYDVLTDFEPVARLPSNPYVVVARKDLPAADLKELVAWLKV